MRLKYFAFVGDSVSTVEYYESVSGRWQLATPMSTLRSRVGISVLNGESNLLLLRTLEYVIHFEVLHRSTGISNET